MASTNLLDSMGKRLLFLVYVGPSQLALSYFSRRFNLRNVVISRGRGLFSLRKDSLLWNTSTTKNRTTTWFAWFSYTYKRSLFTVYFYDNVWIDYHPSEKHEVWRCIYFLYLISVVAVSFWLIRVATVTKELSWYFLPFSWRSLRKRNKLSTLFSMWLR